MSPVMETAVETEGAGGDGTKQVTVGKLRLELQKTVNSSMRRYKAADGSFSYLCLHCEAKLTGRKAAADHLKQEHSEPFDKLIGSHTAAKDLLSEIVKMVQVVPFSDKVAPAPPPEVPEVEVIEEEEPVEKKSENNADVNTKEKPPGEGVKLLPLTLDMMKVVNDRFSLQTDCGGIAGRLARQLGLLFISKSPPLDKAAASDGGEDKKEEENRPPAAAAEEEEDTPSYYCNHCEVYVTSVSELNSHLETRHQQFVENLFKLFPQVRKRFATHLEKVFNEFIIEPKTERKLIEAPASAKVVAGVKRKGDTVATVIESKKKPVARRPMPVLRLPFKLFKEGERYREQQYREKEMLEKLSPSQLRKFVMEYIGLISQAAPIDFPALAAKSKVVDHSPVFLADLCSLLYERAVGYYETANNASQSEGQTRAFKLGHVLINSNQCKLLISRGVRSVRAGILEPKKHNFLLDKWRYPAAWKNITPPGEELGPHWGQQEDSRLLVAGYVLNRDLQKIAEDKRFGFSPVALDEGGKIKDAFRERYGYMLNLFMFRGQLNQSLGTRLAELGPPSPPPADFVAPEPEKLPAAPAPPVTKVVMPAKAASAKKTSMDDTLDKFHQKEKEVDTIILYDDDEEEEDDSKAESKSGEEVKAAAANGAESGAAAADKDVEMVVIKETEETMNGNPPTEEGEAEDKVVESEVEPEVEPEAAMSEAAAVVSSDKSEEQVVEEAAEAQPDTMEVEESAEPAEDENAEEEEEDTAADESKTAEEPNASGVVDETETAEAPVAVDSSTKEEAEKDNKSEELAEASDTEAMEDSAPSSSIEEDSGSDLMDVAVTPSGRGGRGKARGRGRGRRGAK